jgi:hypothetical protein
MSGSTDDPLGPAELADAAPDTAPDAAPDVARDEAGELAAFLAAENVANDYHPGRED